MDVNFVMIKVLGHLELEFETLLNRLQLNVFFHQN